MTTESAVNEIARLLKVIEQLKSDRIGSGYCEVWRLFAKGIMSC